MSGWIPSLPIGGYQLPTQPPSLQDLMNQSYINAGLVIGPNGPTLRTTGPSLDELMMKSWINAGLVPVKRTDF